MLAVLIAAAVWAQSPGAGLATIEGTVISDRTGLPLPRAHVVLRPTQAGVSLIGANTDDRGTFFIRDIEPGRYSILASRDGYLASSVCKLGSVTLPQTFLLRARESVTDLKFRLRAFAIMAGRIAFDDGEPAMSVRVEAYREYRNHLQHGYALISSASTNDRGEYRMFGLPPGAYVVAALKEGPMPGNEKIQGAPAFRYTTTFFPNSTKLSEASPVRLEYGQEVGGIDVFLERVKKVTVHGHVISGETGELLASAPLALQRVDAHGAPSIAVPVQAEFDRNNRFAIRDVTPGSYLLWSEGADGSGKRMEGRVPLTVGSTDVDNMELTLQSERVGSAVVGVESGGKLAESVRLRFEPRSERGRVLEASPDGDGFRFSLSGSDVYDLFVFNLPNDFYLSAVKVNGADALPFGIDGRTAALNHPFEVVLDSRGGRLSGRVLGSDDALWSRASMALIPDPARGRVQSYWEGSADENASFTIPGIAPGKYILLAWLEDAPCDYWDPEAIPSCLASGRPIEVQQSSQQNVELRMKASAKR